MGAPVFKSDELGNSTSTFSDDDVSGKAIVKTRKKVSALFSSFSALMKAAKIDEACEKVKYKEGEYVRSIDPNEIRRTIQTIAVAAAASEETADREKRAHTKERKFESAAYNLELVYNHSEMPAHLAPKKETLSPELQEEKQRLMNALGRNWQRRYKRLHLVMSYIHLGLVDKVPEPKGQRSKKTPKTYIDRTTDLLVAIGQEAEAIKTSKVIKKRNPVIRYNLAAETVLQAFGQEPAHQYAPEWTLEEHNRRHGLDNPDPKDKNPKEKTKPNPGARKWNEVKEALRADVSAALELVREHQLPRDVAEQELYDIIEKAFNDEPEPPGDGERSSTVSLVYKNSDTPPPPDSQSDTFEHSVVCESSDFLSKTEDSAELDTTTLSYLNLDPEAEARLLVEACESVGATMYKAVFTDIYPLEGMAKDLPMDQRSLPRKNGESLSASELKALIPELIRRNREQRHNVAIRIWGPVIQIDDCSLEFYERIKPFCFLGAQTSPNNWQGFMSFGSSYVGADGKRNDALLAIRRRFFEKCAELKESANGGASGSIRMPGTDNIKEKYLPDFPRIHVHHIAKGRMVTPDELDAAGLLAPAPAPKLRLVNYVPPRRGSLSDALPYEYFLQRAPAKEDGNPDLSRVDASFAVHRLGIGESREYVAAQLRGIRDKASKCDAYVQRTLNAAEEHLATQPAPGRERMAV
jgi:hypothetical protein